MSSDTSSLYRRFPIFRPDPKLEEMEEKYQQKKREAYSRQVPPQRNMLWAVVVFLVLLSIPVTLNQVQKKQTYETEATKIDPEIILFETENGEFSGDVFTATDTSASGGKYIHFGPRGVSIDLSSCPRLPTNTGKVVYRVNLPKTGKYYFWSRVMAPDSTNDSFYLQIDDKCGLAVGDMTLPKDTWEWVGFEDGNKKSRIVLDLTKGSHTIALIGREANVKVDKVLLTTEEDCTPILMGVNCAGTD